MSRLLEFFLGSILIAVFTVALMFFSALHLVLRESNPSDCAWQGSARTWIDSNQDGLITRGESAFGGVRIHVEDEAIRLAEAGWSAVTDKDGDVQFNIPIPGCVNTVFQIYADVPAGYRLITRPRIDVNSDLWRSLGPERVYYFGFVPGR
jgi:hypothetical protein